MSRRALTRKRMFRSVTAGPAIHSSPDGGSASVSPLARHAAATRSARLSDTALERGPRPSLFVIGLLAISAFAALVPPLAVPGVVLTLIASLSFPRATGRLHTFGQVATALAALGCVVGLVRFATSKAMLGIVERGQSAAAHSALWRLREVVIAED